MRENDRCLSRFYFCSAAMPGKPPRVRPGAQRLRPRLRDVRDREQANLRFRHAEICFLGSFFAAWQRMNIDANSERAQLGEPVGEVAKRLA